MLQTVVDQTRKTVSKATAAEHKSRLGQYLTPASTAAFMAQMFRSTNAVNCKLLDAGAGIGSLTNAFLARCQQHQLRFENIEVQSFELDEVLHPHLRSTLNHLVGDLNLRYDIHGGDFIEHAINSLQFGAHPGFTHAILNPPYKKISSASRHRLLLRQAGIETVNLYSAFVALALALMAPGGQLVAIIPRSFCNGPYYKPFREFILQRAAIRHLHLFASRDSAFKDDEVLQENIIIFLERGAESSDVTVSTSTDDSFSDLASQVHPFKDIVLPTDAERFIHVPDGLGNDHPRFSTLVNHSLAELGVQVSTGPVVDFRLKEFLRDQPDADTVPLLYPSHFGAQGAQWPMADFKKPNAIAHVDATEKWLYGAGYYCVVRRFSSKEEKRRVVANVVRPQDFGNAARLGFENHLNVFHQDKHGLPADLAAGLTVFLNSSAVDRSFRQYNGHTQVNATDLKRMRYPTRTLLMALGRDAGELPLTQERIDRLTQVHGLS